MLSLLVLTSTSMAYETRCAWADTDVTIAYQQADLAAYGDLIDRLKDAARRVDRNPSAARFSMVQVNDGIQTNGNGRNDLVFDTLHSVATTTVDSTAGVCNEFDVHVNPNFVWTLTNDTADNPAYVTGANSGDFRPLLSTGIHEFGHVLGLKHEADVLNSMGQPWTALNMNNGETRAVVTEDAVSGLLSLYGPRADAFEDLTAYHWKWKNGNSNGYSVHERSEVFPGNSATAVTPLSGQDEPTYELDMGQDYDVEVTLENVGKTNHAGVDVCVYLSTNDNITGSDTLLTTVPRALSVNTPRETEIGITLPTTMNPGQAYWIGAMVDCEKDIQEKREKNNAVALFKVFGI